MTGHVTARPKRSRAEPPGIALDEAAEIKL